MSATAARRLALIVAAAAALAVLGPPISRQRARRAALDAETARWIARSREVYLLLDPDLGDLRVRAQPVRLATGLWFSTDCYLPERGFVGSCWWDPRTNRLDMMSFRPARREERRGVPLDARDARAAALRWATLLGAMRSDETWVEASQPDLARDQWALRFRWDGRTAFVLLDVWSGKPRMMRVSRAR